MIVLWFFLGAALLFLTQRAVYQRFWSRRLSVCLRFDQRAVTAGQTATITEQIENRKLLPLTVFRLRYGVCRNFELLRDRNGRARFFSYTLALPARRSVRSRTELKDLPRGIYAITEASIGAQDLFCTERLSEPVTSHSMLTVYPAKLPAERLQLPFRQLLGAILTRHYAQEDPFEIRSIRPYEPYDSMRMINWKASARTGELKVNLHDHTTDESLLLLLDMESGSILQREQVISLGSSLCSLFLRRGIGVSVFANSRSCIGGSTLCVPAGAGVSHQRVIDESLAQIKLSTSVPLPFAAFLERLSDGSARRELCTVISAGGSPEISAAFDRLCGKNGGFYISLSPGQAVQGSRFTLLPYTETEATA